MSLEDRLGLGAPKPSKWGVWAALLAGSAILTGYFSGPGADRRAEVESLESTVESLSEELPSVLKAQEREDELTRSFERLQAELAQLDQMLPPHLDWDRFVDEVEEDASRLGLDLEVVSLEVPYEGEFVRSQETSFLARGPFESIAQLPGLLEARTALRRVLEVSLQFAEGPQQELRFSVKAYAALEDSEDDP